MGWSPTTQSMSVGGLLLVALAHALTLQDSGSKKESKAGGAPVAAAPAAPADEVGGPLVIEFDPEGPPLVLPRDERLTFRVRVGMGIAVGTVHMQCEVQSTQGGVVLKRERESKAPRGNTGHMLITAQGDYQFYSLDASIETFIDQEQRWPWIVNKFEQKGSKKYKRELHLGWEGEQPRAWYRRDSDRNAPEGARIWKAAKQRELPAPSLDMLSAVYYARAIVREDRMYLSFPVADKLDLWEIVLRRGKAQQLETDAGTFNAVQLILDPRPYKGEEPGERTQERAKKFEGLFGLQGSIELWVEEKTGVPLLIAGEIPVGPIDLDIDVLLQSYSGTPPEFKPLP